jgi:trk system potassium uptake protein TrkA
MNVVIVGCGRVGAVLADAFDRAGHQVVILDISTRAFDRLPGSFRGNAVRGNGTDEDVLRRAGAEGADLFIAMTEGDNRNIMATQLALEALGVKQVIAKINDPVRAEAYSHLGIPTLCRTSLMGDAVFGFVGMPLTGTAPIMSAVGHHPGEEHHAPPAPSTPPVGSVGGVFTAPEAY